MDLVVLASFSASLAAPWLNRLARGVTGWLLALLPVGLFAYFAAQAGTVAGGNSLTISRPWVPSMGLHLSFMLDGLALLFALLITGIGALVLIYTSAYMAGHPQLGRFYAFLLLFMGSMLGLVLAGNALTLFVFWELTSISSYLLIGFDHERQIARAAALQALLVTGGGGLAMLAGFVLLGQVAGSFELAAWATQAATIRAHGLYLPALLLVLAGAFTKSAQMPFHFWLPNAMEAPTPISAYLHSATMVKAGVYLLARLSPALGDTSAWYWLVAGTGAVTAAVAGYMALQHNDLKRILAYTTVSALGILVLLIGLGTPHAVLAAMVFLPAHALYKGALFMVAGAIDHETGTRDVTRLGGLWRAMPLTAVAALLAAVSLAAFGPVLSFIGKELLFEAALAADRAPALWTIAALVFGLTGVGAALLVTVRPLFGPSRPATEHAHKAPAGLWLGSLILAAVGFLEGIFPSLAADLVIGPATAAVLATPPPAVELELWHGLNPALGLSVLSLLLGTLAYRFRFVLVQIAERSRAVFDRGPARWYDAALDGVYRLAHVQTRLLQSGYLRAYLLSVIFTAIVLAGYALLGRPMPAWWVGLTDLHLIDVGVVALILLGAIAAVRSQSRLAAVAALSVVGYGVALVFILFGAPDVAMTQFLVETLTVILLVLVFYHLPAYATLSSPRARRRDLLIALAAGSLMTILVLMVTGVQYYPPISDYFVATSLPEAHGRNIVNAILVDFRGFDTMGEITVLSLAAIGVYALLKLRPMKREDE